MKLGIIGSRSITDKDKVYEIINEGINKASIIPFENNWEMYNTLCKNGILKDKQFKIDTIISGGAIGVDSIAKEYAKDNDLWYVEYSPDDEDYSHLKKHERPLRRNTDIAQQCDVLLAIWDGYSTGTIRTCNVAKLLGKKVILEII